MKKSAVLLPAAIVTVLLSAMVLASPNGTASNETVAGAPNRAEAYRIAVSG